MAKKFIYKKCKRCAGTGQVYDTDDVDKTQTKTCPDCDGKKVLLWGILRDTLIE